MPSDTAARVIGNKIQLAAVSVCYMVCGSHNTSVERTIR